MKPELLQSEFLRLSEQYPELRHAVVIGDERWRAMPSQAINAELFGDLPLKILSTYSLNDDRLAHVYFVAGPSRSLSRVCG